LGRIYDDDSQDRIGLFYTHTEASGDVVGNTLAQIQVHSGKLDLDGDSIGAYWTHVSSSGWYVDAVAMATWLDGDATSDRRIGADMSGHAILASLEAGYAFELGRGWTLEPQGQIIWQRVDLDDTHDLFSSIDYDDFDVWTGRLGLRLEGNTRFNDMPVQPFVDINLWHDFEADYSVVFNDRAIVTETESTLLEVGVGVSAQFTENVSGYGSVKYMTGVDGSSDDSYGGNLGMRVKW